MEKNKPYFLVAEDDLDDQFLLQEMFSHFCDRTRARFLQNGVELMNFLENKKDNPVLPSLVLLDLNMPYKDGRKALSEIRENPDLESLPVVVLTTSSNEKDIQYCREKGVDAFYTKPSSMDELRGIIKCICFQYA